MIVGILKEIKTEENRVCMTPAGVEIMKAHGHEVLVEDTAGEGSGFSNENYLVAGAEIVAADAAIGGVEALAGGGIHQERLLKSTCEYLIAALDIGGMLRVGVAGLPAPGAG